MTAIQAPSAFQDTRPLLRVDGLSKTFMVGRTFIPGSGQAVRAVDAVSFDVFPGETLGLVGESGCGKSTLGRSLMRLHDVSAGRIELDGIDIARLSPRQLRPYRRHMQMIFQDPAASLNPRRRVGDLLAEPLRVHRIADRAGIARRLRELMDIVSLPASFLDRYPHEFSGGQRQRIGIARALALEPKLIVADEPVSALDVSVQAQIVNLLSDLRRQLQLTTLFIAHDLSVVRQVSERTAVMYLGSIVEIGQTDLLFRRPAHPYTQALLSAIPVPRLAANRKRERILLKGEIPSPANPPSGCRFHPRCPVSHERCRTERPALTQLADGRKVACHFPFSLQTT
ncbi:MAG TPA: oligopeptide/dipeptide ABC transporter ATP-binding protein [Mesorhizobium sp.]|jgi:peptide/nickel transport system ATP-binding protein|uniref:ABC transporter ATP-binding protein n=1 Tax=Mesorhizobium sp. TaxID=1871066 RepID=UPI002DDD50CD|nr:oligopeptide/dipeptide ABC transporter ATP-binding protein [Mesorhizobium sp.]HEV2507106.1 oligopeptide/dipeptide ABC transporter ATP-binding protein [Mesorhizobium sp.]